jgi:hypothetical protein
LTEPRRGKEGRGRRVKKRERSLTFSHVVIASFCLTPETTMRAAAVEKADATATELEME